MATLFPQVKPQGKLPVKILVVIGAVIGLAIVAVRYWKIEPAYSFLNTVTTTITSKINAITPAFSGITTFISQNQWVLPVATFAGSAIIIPLMKQYFQNKATQATNEASAQVMQISSAYQQSQAKVQDLQNQINSQTPTDTTSLTESLNEATSQVALVRAENQRLMAQLQQQNLMLSPSLEDMAYKLRQNGYEVIKKVLID